MQLQSAYTHVMPLYEHTIHCNEYVCVYTCAEAMMKCFLIFLLQKDVDIVNLAYK